MTAVRGRSADRGVGDGVRVTHPAKSQGVQVRRHRLFVAVTTEMRPSVLTADRVDIGPLGSREKADQCEQKDKARGHIASFREQRRIGL